MLEVRFRHAEERSGRDAPTQSSHGVVVPGQLVAWALVSPVDAQVTTIETVPPEVDDEGRTASERVDGVVVMLRILGGVVIVSTAAFWWRTRPPTTGKEREDEPAEVV